MSITQTIEEYTEFKIFLTDVQETYLCVTALVTDAHADPIKTCAAIYERIATILSDAETQIIHERIFGNIDINKAIIEVRNPKIRQRFNDDPGLVTYVEGKSCYGNPLAGIQLRSFRPPDSSEKVQIIQEGDIPRGRMWHRNGALFLQLQSLLGGLSSNAQNRKIQAEKMFREAEAILKSRGASFRDVARTWIYVEDILDWYSEFNLARNTCYNEFGLLNNGDIDNAEDIFLPASTGIEGENPDNSPTIMDLLAISNRDNTGIQIEPLYGDMQHSPYRYGSAFARAMKVIEPEEKWIFVSGTASLNEKGETVHKGDLGSQVKHTVEVVNSLIHPEGVSFSNLCEATVFLKNKSDFSSYQETAESLGLSNIPAVYLIADVCWDDLLFELDAAFVAQK